MQRPLRNRPICLLSFQQDILRERYKCFYMYSVAVIQGFYKFYLDIFQPTLIIGKPLNICAQLKSTKMCLNVSAVAQMSSFMSQSAVICLSQTRTSNSRHNIASARFHCPPPVLLVSLCLSLYIDVLVDIFFLCSTNGFLNSE